MKKHTPKILFCALALCAFAACTHHKPANLYGTYTLHRTTDYMGQEKTPNEEVISLTLNEDSTYEVLFENDTLSTGTIVRDFGYETSEDYVLTFPLQLSDYRNAYEPSYVFYLRVELDKSMSLVHIPQGVGDNSWVETADFWNLTKGK